MRSALLIIALGSFVSSAPATAQVRPQGEPLAIVGARVLSRPDAEPIPDGVIVIQDGRIVQVGPRGSVEVPESARVLDARGLTATAGFWNAHVHLVDIFAPRWMGARTMAAESLALRLEESFSRFGTTAVVDLGSLPDNTLAIRERIEQKDVPGPRILTAMVPIYPPGGAPEPARAAGAPEPRTPAEGTAAVDAMLAAGADLIKLATAYHSLPGGQGEPGRMSLETVRATVARAHERDALVVAHPEDLEGVRTAVLGGVDVLAHTTESGGPWPTELVERMVESGIALVPTLYLYHVGITFRGGSPEEAAAYVERTGVLDQLRAFHEAGGEVLFGTDVGFFPVTDMTGEYQLMARAGMRWDAILASLTTAPAARFGRGDSSGIIAPGMDGDVVLLGSDPAQDVMAFADVRTTIRGGEVIYGDTAARGSSVPAHGSPPPAHGVEYRGGRWFDGSEFVPKTMYVADGVLRTAAPARIDSVIDLAGGFVVPPFGDAHQHLVDPRIDATIGAQLGDGVFYVKDQGNAPILRWMIDPALNQPASFDYVSANQGWTSPGGHPVVLIRRGASEGPFAAYVRDSLDPGLVMQVASEDDVERRWSYFLAGRPDFVKVYLYHSEDHERLRDDPAAEGNRGMDPRLVPEIVRRAEAAGLEVSAHVYTAADFRSALEAGVHHMAHLPGGRGPDSLFLLTDADAAEAARRGVTVATTVSQHLDTGLTVRLLATQYAHNVDVLRRHGVPILVGSDLFPGTAATEVAALAGSGLFTNLELLTMWSVTTPRAIFPDRRIGALEDGYEASFLVLRADPLMDMSTRDIALRVKQGVPIPTVR